MCLEDESYLQDIKKIIKDQRTGTIPKLKLFYPEETLQKINKDARPIWYFSDDATKKYYNSITLTGYEEKGLIYSDGMWCYLNILTKKQVAIDEDNIKIRKKTNN